MPPACTPVSDLRPHPAESLAPRDDRRNSIGFLRLALAALVVYTHCYRIGGYDLATGDGDLLWEWSRHTVPAGTLAVQGFFVLSGALVAASWNRAASLARFLWHRFLRLAPALWICLAVTAFVFTPLLHLATPEPRTPFFEQEPSAWGYVWHNLLRPRAQIAIGIYPNGGPWAGDWNGSLWTLFYEGACYLMIAALGLVGLLRRGRRLGAAGLICFVALYTVWSLAQPAWLPARVGRLFDTPGKELTMFFFAGTVWAIVPEIGTALLRRAWTGPAACLLLVLVWRLGLNSSLGPWLLTPALFWLARVLPLADFEKRVGGDYSYGLYVYGYPIQQVLAHFHLHELGYTPYLGTSFLLASGCAIASWHAVERRALGWKSWQPRWRQTTVPTGLTP